MHLYVDVSALAHSAAHAMREEEIALGPAQVALAVVSQVGQFVRHYRPRRTYFCLDSPKDRITWRKAVEASYKANRAEMYQDDPQRLMRRQMADKALQKEILELIDLVECPRFQMPHIEADDIAAALVAMNPGTKGILVTTDKDYWQLINPTVSFLNPTHQYRVEMGPNGTLVQHKADGTSEDLGFTPKQHLLIKALHGDDGDNLDGLCGVGEVGARKAVLEGRASALITEMTGMVTPRKSKKNPSPVPHHQDAKAIVSKNIAMMDLLNSQVHGKVRLMMEPIEKAGIRSQRTGFTKLVVWLEANGIKNEELARSLSTTFTDQWIS
jgi:5'-3' exonuclease